MRKFLRDFRRKVLSKLTLGKIAAAVLLAAVAAVVTPAAKAAFAPWIHEATDALTTIVDSYTCKGIPAMAEGDRLVKLASADPKQAADLFRSANDHYRKAYACGYPDAGIRLAVSYCMGLGETKSGPMARQIILDIEAKYPERRGRAGDVRRLCGF